MFGPDWNNTAKIFNTSGEISNINMTNVAWTNVAWTDVAWTDVAWTNVAWTNFAWTCGTEPFFNSQGWFCKLPRAAGWVAGWVAGLNPIL